MKECNKLIFYSDLLGFTKYLNENEEDAISSLEGLEVNFVTNNENTLDDILSVSDSVFVISDNKNVDDKVKNIAEIISRAFIYNRPLFRFDDDPEKVEHTDIGTGNKRIHFCYPSLYRSAFGIGDVYTVRSSTKLLLNLTGKAVANTVKLGESGVGPRLYLTEDVINILGNKTKNRIVHDLNENKKYYLWPTSLFINLSEEDMHDLNRICNSFEGFNSMLEIVCKHYAEKGRVSEIYLDLLDMFLRSYRQFVLEWGNDLSDALLAMNDYIARYCSLTRYKKLRNDLIFKQLCLSRAQNLIKI